MDRGTPMGRCRAAAQTASSSRPFVKISVETVRETPQRHYLEDRARPKPKPKPKPRRARRHRVPHREKDGQSNRNIIDDGIDRTLSGLQSAASGVADFLGNLSEDVQKLPDPNLQRFKCVNNQDMPGFDSSDIPFPEPNFEKLSCVGKEGVSHCGSSKGLSPGELLSQHFKCDIPDCSTEPRDTGMHGNASSDDASSDDAKPPGNNFERFRCGGKENTASVLHMTGHDFKFAGKGDILKCSTKCHAGNTPVSYETKSINIKKVDVDTLSPADFAALFYGKNGPGADHYYTSDEDSISINTAEMKQQDEEDQIRRLGSWSTIDSTDALPPPTALALDPDTINPPARNSYIPMRYESIVDIPEEAQQPTVRAPLSQSPRTYLSVSPVSQGLPPLSSPRTIQSVTSSSPSPSSRKSVSFEYPPIKSMKAVPRIPADAVSNLFFSPEELDLIETDRLSTRGTEDVEAIAVLDPEKSQRRSKPQFVSQVQIFLRSPVKRSTQQGCSSL